MSTSPDPVKFRTWQTSRTAPTLKTEDNEIMDLKLI